MLSRASYGNVDVLVPTWDDGSSSISRSHFRVKFEPKNFARQTSKEIEEEIETVWKSKSTKNKYLYNATKFRLAGCEVIQHNFVLHLGITDYKDLHGTNLLENFSSLQLKGVGLLAVTSDDCLVVVRRAQWTGEYPGALDRPGGHPEPSHIFSPNGSLKPSYSNLKIEEVVEKEVWESVGREAMDELGISAPNIKEVILMGVTCNMNAGGKPTLEFFTKLNMSSDQIISVYTMGLHAEAGESTSIHLVQPKTLSLIPRLLLTSTHTHLDGAVIPLHDQEEPVNDIHVKEAKWLLRESTPTLHGALHLAVKSCSALFSFSAS